MFIHKQNKWKYNEHMSLFSDMVIWLKNIILSVQFYNILSTYNAKIKLFSTHSWSLTTKINYSCGLDNNILEKVKKITNMVYKIVEIKYTVLHVMQSWTKKANVVYTGQSFT